MQCTQARGEADGTQRFHGQVSGIRDDHDNCYSALSLRIQ